MKYTVYVDQTTTRSWELEIDAEHVEEAMDKAKEMGEADKLGDDWTFTDYDKPFFSAEEDGVIVEG